ncbi:XisI protein [Romeria aff. gracilis LEGE 07310]|uniref:XisI protein n=1 Tax=Vasconcelosia minhoensis LEGE 07310 TaxID=915328 RepID=A0A8J7DMR2_9CYAN|nr:XisI protein [Romeria gracilis]MBE9077165.1 XisI protein [Romeria aff. gracilis LEGE 07310]
MDKLNLYRQLIQQSLLERAKLRAPDDPVKSQTVCDHDGDHYQLVNLGWKNSSTRIYGCAIHADIIDGKIWVQRDGTEDAIADQLIEKGVPKQDIVLAYHAPHVRQYTEFAVG